VAARPKLPRRPYGCPAASTAIASSSHGPYGTAARITAPSIRAGDRADAALQGAGEHRTVAGFHYDGDGEHHPLRKVPWS
jgi:hypothetical protein